jgi:hypothetical protein
MFGVIQAKVAEEVGVTFSQTMDLLETSETQVLAKFLDYQKHLPYLLRQIMNLSSNKGWPLLLNN